MKQTATYIQDYCRIRDNSVTTREGVIFRKPGVSLDDFLTAIYDWINPGYPKFYKMDRLSKLGFLGSEILLKDKALKERHSPEAVALVLSNAHSSLDTDVRYWESTRTVASPALFVYTLPNIVTGEICIRHGFKGENAFFVSDKFNADLLSSYVEMVLDDTVSKACIAGWVDVMDGHHDVFLYLTEKQKQPASQEHAAGILADLYA
jgi:hypothetical protein